MLVFRTVSHHSSQSSQSQVTKPLESQNQARTHVAPLCTVFTSNQSPLKFDIPRYYMTAENNVFSAERFFVQINLGIADNSTRVAA